LTVNTYSPSDVDLLINGYKVSGWKTVEIKRDSDSYKFIRGCWGKNTRVRNRNTSALIEVVISQTSETNDVLSEIHRKDTVDPDADEFSTADCGRLVVTLKDRSGTSAFQSEDAYIVAYPSGRYSSNFEDRSWMIQCLSTNTFTIGGNLRPSTALFDSIFSRF
jgi:hypothetical protein